MFSGQGSQYVNMGLELYQTESIFREQVDYCAEYLKPHLNLDLRTVLYPNSAQNENQPLNQTALSQPALFVIEYALAQLWMSWGIQPAAMIGHSIGEYVAACLAKVLTLYEALVLVAARGRLMQSMPSGTMLAVPLTEAEIRPLLNDTIDLATINVPSQSVISGPTEAVEQFAAQLLAEQGLECQLIYTSHAFHSAMMSPILPSFLEQVQKIQLHSPKVPYLSNVTGTWIKAEEATDPNYWVKHLRQTVRFADGLQPLVMDSKNILLEVGPGRTLSTFAKRHPDKVAGQVVLTSLRHPKDELSDNGFLLNTLGQLWLVGVVVLWAGEEQRQRLPLPTYPFERQRYWIEVSKEKRITLKKLDDFESLQKEETVVLHSRQKLNDEYASPRNETEKKIAEIWQNFLGIAKIGIYDDFFELGGDSLTAVQLITKLRKTLSVELFSHSLLNTPTIATLAESIEQISSKSSALPFSLVEIQAGNKHKLPLFMVHPAGGHVYIYRDLAHCLGTEQPVYGLQATTLDGKTEHSARIEDRAIHFIEALRARQPEGPYLLGGHSFGSMVAFEMAQQLYRLGQKVALLVMIDPPQPGAPIYTVDDVDILALLVGMDNNASLAQIRQLSFDKQVAYFLEHGKTNNKLFTETTQVQLRQLFHLFKIDLEAILCYVPQTYTGKVIFFRANERDEFINPPYPERGWSKFIAKKMEVYEVPGNHFTMNYSPHVEFMADMINKYLIKVDNKNESMISKNY